MDLALAGTLGVGVGIVVLIFIIINMAFRRIVPVNEVHILQVSGNTKSYGKGQEYGNTYYKWPSWVPFFGVLASSLPVSNFDVDLIGYEAYDKARLPFLVNIKAFFRISDSNTAAQRISSVQELHAQLTAIVQGAVRAILVKHTLEEIMEGRGTFGIQFTQEVEEQLKDWGVSTVKNIELMDICDTQNSVVIKNIMEKEKSRIEMESRIEVAKNKQAYQEKEIEANREVKLKDQEAVRATSMREIEVSRETSLAREKMAQEVKELEKTTKEKEMEVLKVEETKKAEINREVSVVKAKQDKETMEILAEGKLKQQELDAQGKLKQQELHAQGVKAVGTAEADAEKAKLLAPVEAQITLADKIGKDEGYQRYLLGVEKIRADEKVGIEQAKALANADINIVANAGKPAEGVKTVMDMFTSAEGGSGLGAFVQGLANTPAGNAALKVMGVDVEAAKQEAKETKELKKK